MHELAMISFAARSQGSHQQIPKLTVRKVHSCLRPFDSNDWEFFSIDRSGLIPANSRPYEDQPYLRSTRLPNLSPVESGALKPRLQYPPVLRRLRRRHSRLSVIRRPCAPVNTKDWPL